ncbi:MAG: ferritin family protein [Candidatus Omnitrophota bacterium]
MEKAYNSRDILQMAIQAKAKGVELYLNLARNSENYHVGKLFTEFAKDEERHKLELTKCLKEDESGTREEAYPGEKALYLKALVDSGTFNCDAVQKHMLERTISEEEALQAGITFEKDFMLFLHNLKRHAEKEGGKTIDSLIEDEVHHLEEMFQLKEKLAREK